MTIPPEENPYRPPSGPVGMPPMPPAYIPPAPPPKAKSASTLVVIGAILVALVVGGWVVRVVLRQLPSDTQSIPAPTTTSTTTSTPPKYVAGDCVSMTGSSINPAFDEVDCASGKGNYVVAKVPESGESCGENYSKYTRGSLKVCLIPVFVDGECYNFSVAGISAETPKMDCSPFVVKATVLKDTVDPAACGPNVGKALAYPEIKVTYCLNQGS